MEEQKEMFNQKSNQTGGVEVLENSINEVTENTVITAIMAQNQNVYHGPQLVENVYASVGSVDEGETVEVLATSMGWYHIQYTVTSTGKKKTGYIPQESIASISEGTLNEEEISGGYRYATTELDVRTCKDFSLTAPVGTLFKNEGCTCLAIDGDIAFIEYSSTSGTKRGYVYARYLASPCRTIACIAKENVKVYAGPSTETYAQLGSIYITEIVSLLAKDGNMIYVEYNTNKGRKRGYIDWNKVTPYNYVQGTSFNDFYVVPENSVCHIVNEKVTVYGGPTTDYAALGSVNHENVTSFWTNDSNFGLTCIEYIVGSTGKLKRGYVDSSKVITGGLALENNEIEQFNDSYNYFGNKIYYGQTQLGKDMFYYRAGNGINHMFLVFGLHGWEDGVIENGQYKHGDGNMLLKIAKNFMNRFIAMENSKIEDILEGWSIFVFPGVNLDGIVNGYTNDGFGRCLYNGYDPNRSFPGKFKVLTSPRNKTGDSYFGDNTATEIINLKNTLMSNKGTGENVLIDIHGWLNSFLSTNSELAGYYKSEMENINPNFRFQDVTYSTNDSGYLITWARNPSIMFTTTKDMAGLGAKTGLLELPATTDYSDSNILNNYGLRFFNATINVLENFSSIDRSYLNDVVTPENKKQQLNSESSELLDDLMVLYQDIKSERTTEEAAQNVMAYDSLITSLSNTYKVRKALIQTVFMWEHSLEGKDDSLSDSLVQQYYEYQEQLKEWLKNPTGLMAPQPPLISRKDCSTGLCQIFASTAIKANNWAIEKQLITGKEYDADNLDDIWEVWQKLHNDNEYNLTMATLALLWGAEDRGVHTNTYGYNAYEIKKVLARYNGTNDDATAYGERNYAIYELYESYNKEAREAN